jgi:hypothetical protein
LGRLIAWLGVSLLFGAAYAALHWAPWRRGTTLFSLSSTHGIDTGDLPALALLAVAVAVAARWAAARGRRR